MPEDTCRLRTVSANLKAALFAQAIVCFVAGPLFADEYRIVAVLSGIAKVADGDGILFGNVEVRLQGIAAPEIGELGGDSSTKNLQQIADGQMIVCHLDGTTAGRTGRPAGICYAGSVDIGEYQVSSGKARDCPAYSRGRYAEVETSARANGRDLAAVYALPEYCN
ncbi:hypothetical protein [Mesorhizobium sp. Z1-4]|uniref:thermonuclease family protein n=1 Tax=Mesorhizobium sp. Z1-4 TaxID=2448478 RepID=UPI000FDC81E2|nr:hypothetical protein [Mesorhizobium sp. Z1-4]